MYTKKWGSNILIQSTGGVIALSCWAPLHKQLPAQATPTNLEVPYLQVPTYQCVTRSLFQFLRREREFLSFNLVLRDENENFFFQSQASRQEQESRLK